MSPRLPTTAQGVDAITLAGWGFDVLPLLPPHPPFPPHVHNIIPAHYGKRPLLANGHNGASHDHDTVCRWWTQWPTANIGARPAPSHVVLDVDVRSGGMDTWHGLTRGHELPCTLITETGTGGLHVWFQLPYQGELKKYAGPGIDIKHHGGQLVMPGSTHAKTGKPYRVRQWCAPDRLPELPVFLRRHVYKPPPAPKPIIPINFRTRPGDGSNLVRMVLEAGEGARNDTLNKAAFIAAANNLDITGDLAQAAETTGLEPSEIRATLHSATRAAQQSTTQVPV